MARKNVIAVSVLLDNKQFKRGIAETSSATQTLGAKFKTVGEGLTTAFSATAVLGVKAVTGAVAGLVTTLGGLALAGGISRYLAIDEAKAKLAGLGYTGEQVAGIMEDARKAVTGTAFGLGDAATVATNLLAAGVEQGDELTRSLTLTADAATIAGVGLGEMGGIWNKVAANGRLTTEVMQQFTDRGVPLLQYVADHYGITQEAAADMVRNGKIDLETFEAIMEKNLGGAAQKSGETFKGAMANVMAALGRLGEMFVGPVMDAAKDLFKDAIPAIDDMAASLKPVAEEFAENLKPAVAEFKRVFVDEVIPALVTFYEFVTNDVVPAVKDLFNNLKGFVEWVDANKDWLAPVAVGLGTFVGLLGALHLGLTLGIGAIKTFKTVTEIAKAAQLLFNASLLANPFIVVAALLAALVGGLIYFFTQTETGKKAWEAFTETVKRLWDDFSKFMSNIWDNIVKFFDGGVKGAKNIVATLSQWVGDRFNDIKNAGDTVGRFFTTDVPAFFGRAKGAIAERFAAVKDGILKPIKSALDWINDNFIKKINGFLGSINISWRLPELSIPGYSDGGYTGHGHWLKPAGIVHAGEIVWSQKDIRRHGGIAAVEAMRLRGYATGGIVANATQGFRGYDPKALAAMLAWAKATGRIWHMTGAGGARDYATQARLYAKYLAGHGPLAANPARGGPHMYPAIAMDLSPRPGEHAASRALLPKFGLGLTVRGEPWHIGYLGGRSDGTTKGGFNPFGFMEGLLDGIKFAEPIGSIVKAALKEAVKGIQLFDNGGWLKPGHIGFNASNEPEAVFTKKQLANHGNTYVFNGIEVKSQRVEELLDELAQEITRMAGVGV